MIEWHETRIVWLERCGETIRMVLERPQGYEYRAGQWFRLALQTSQGEETKTFSHASAPSDPHIELATRTSGSSFKQAMASLAAGDTVRISPPGGRLRVPEGARRVAFLTGGTGITPVRSLMRDMKGGPDRPPEVLLVFGNRSPECVPFLDELLDMEGHGVRVVPVYEDAPGSVSAERGFITSGLVKRLLGGTSGWTFVVTGPPAMVTAMDSVRAELGDAAQSWTVERFG